ncbi:iojap-like protein [Gracilinema caldarium DSM 7334]|uniref:Ribosomal silencing factor RsfS n=2 Tax=Gracilinema caldarium TaxID=215591 RepID=F8F078_GRAC1|nr:iojap-like protein [Gracilinema caldarium DSM 7334]
MDDMLHTKETEIACNLAKLIFEHKGQRVVVLDLRSLHTWTDFFIISTVTSSTHQQGLQRHIKEFAQAEHIDILRRQRKAPAEDEWTLIDMGTIVVHLMTEKARMFYDLERLWSEAPILWKAES